MLGARCNSHASATCIGVALEGCRSRVERCRLDWREPSEREVGHVGDTLCGKVVDERIVGALGQVVEVLDADNFRDCLRLRQLAVRDCAEPDVVNRILLFEAHERGEWLFKWLIFRRGESAEAQIHHLQRLEAQVAQSVSYGIDHLLAGASVEPGTVGAAAPTHFGHDRQIVRIRMQRLPDDLIGYMRTVEIAGIDVVHARDATASKNRDIAPGTSRGGPQTILSPSRPASCMAP